MFIQISLKKCIWCLFHTVTPAHHVRGSGQGLGITPNVNSISTHVVTEKNVLPGSSKRQRREDKPQCTTIMSHGLACYSKGAELASRSEADVHLFWHFLSTLTQKTHDNTWLSAFLKYRLFDKASSLPLFSSPWYLKLLSTQYRGGENHDVVLWMWGGTGRRQVT